MPYGIRITLDGEDITNKVSRFEITVRIDAYCREISIDIADPDLYDSLDFSVLPETPALEVETRIASAWYSQGKFFIEKPTFQVGIHRTETGLWGRSETALLGTPFATKFTQTWDSDTTFFTICSEMCTAAGLAWDPSYSAIDDFTVHARTYTAENLTPVEIIQQLLELAYGEDAFLTTDRSGHVVIALRDRAPAAADHSITDPVTVSISEEPEWPEFGNRIRITSTGSTSGYSIQVQAANACLSGDGKTRARLYARVTDQEGNAANNVPVSWSTQNSLVTLDSAVTNSQTIIIYDEEVRAKSFWEIDLKFPPSAVRGVYAYKDTSYSLNLAAAGVTIDGNTVTLASRLTYCDQLLKVTYAVDGVAVNWATAGTTSGNEKVTADISGQAGSVDLYVDNPCNCPPSITLSANPSSILIKESSSLLVYVEMGGAPVMDGRSVYMSIDSSPSHGKLAWTKARLGRVEILNELCQVRNEIAGISQIQVACFPYSVTGVYQFTEDDDGERTKTGSNLYSSHNGKTINLNTAISSETELLVDYVAYGCATCIYDGIKVGTDKIKAFVVTSREEPTEASTSISVSKDENDSEDKDPEDCCNEGLCQGEGTPCNSEEAACEGSMVYGTKAGVEGCFDSGDLDSEGCDEGLVTCRKDGEIGCHSPGECDSTYVDGGNQKKYGFHEGQAGCFVPSELDPCQADTSGEDAETEEDTDDPYVMCFSGGIKGCYHVSECDVNYGITEARECPTGTVCCEDAVTGEKGCWASGSCKSTDPGDHDPHDKDPDTISCRMQDGTVKTCGKGQTCCEKGGKRDCHPSKECDGGGAGCATSPCQDNPTEECLDGRFGGALAKGCQCTELCENEITKYGTTQANEDGSYRPLNEIVADDYGLEEGTPEFDEQYDQLKTSALDECRSRCGDCENAQDLTISGSDAVTSPGGYQYAAAGGLQPYTWEATGMGASIDDSGYLILDASGCGAFTVTVTDSCGITAELTGRVTNNGHWVLDVQMIDCAFSTIPCTACGPNPYSVMSGDTWTYMNSCDKIFSIEPDVYFCSEWFTPVQVGANEWCVYDNIQIFKWECL